MIDNFPASLAFTRKEEGGNDDDPHDHGGRTSRGIIQREWDAWRQTHPGLPDDVWQAPDAEIDDIYKAQYWNPYCDALPGGVDLFFFDTCVNAGRQQAVKLLQRALGVTADGMFGIATRAAVAAATPATLVHAFAERRRDFYRALRQFPRYGRGWIGRTNRCELASMALAPAAAPAVPSPMAVPAAPKADPEDMAQPIMAPEKAGALSAGTGSVSAMLQQVSDQISPYATVVHAVQYVLIGIAVIGIALTFYGLWHRSKTQDLLG